jgi:diaminopropionate ammonia-lyase
LNRIGGTVVDAGFPSIFTKRGSMNQSGFEKPAWYKNTAARDVSLPKSDCGMCAPDKVQKVRRFHRTIPRYRPTPLINLNRLAGQLRVAHIRVKDESRRCGLNAFKVLGASYGICRAIADSIGMAVQDLEFDDFAALEIRKNLGAVTVVTATDGNHGRAVAWVAEQLGCRAVVFMPKGSSRVRLENIRKHGASASIIDGNYDDAVQKAMDEAQKNGWLLVQDTVRPGYEKIPTWIMQGYATMMDEVCEQAKNRMPSHVFVQCGVGSFAASIQAYLVQKYGDGRPVLTVVEPTRAGCFFESIRSKAKLPLKIEGDLDTIMAGLACGEPSSLAWGILRDFSDAFVVCPDDIAMLGMRTLGNPGPGDEKIISGESGAVTLGLLVEILRNPEHDDLKQALGIHTTSDILVFSTEGDTDPGMYAKIVRGSSVSGD